MKILFLGGTLDQQQEKKIIENKLGTIDNAANVFQHKIINGLKKYDMNLISVPFIGTFPNNSKIIKYKKSANDDKKIKYIEFLNIWGIRNISRYYQLKKYIKKNKNEIKESDLLIVYSLHSPFLKNLKLVKKINNKIKIITVVPDLPEYMNLSKHVSIFYKILKKIDMNIIQKNKKYIDGYIVLTEYMIDKINDKKCFKVIDGIANSNGNMKNTEFNTDKNIIMYAGTLDEKYGIMNLLQAFMQIKEENYELRICGKGEMKSTILKCCEEDKRIKFYGTVEHEKLIKLMQESDILINPRTNQDFTRYSFPSKILEYLEQGKMVISYKLDCFSKEYDDFIYYPQNETVESLAEKIIEVSKIGNEAKKKHSIQQQEFIRKYKNEEYQTKKIIELFYEMEKI